MSDYALFADALTFVNILDDSLVAAAATPIGDALRLMRPGEHLIPLFSSIAVRGEDEERLLDRLADDVLHMSGQELLEHYARVAGHVPYILQVRGVAKEESDSAGGRVRFRVPIEIEELPKALPSSDFLRLRSVSEIVAAQFQGATPPRPIQEVPHAVIKDVRLAARADRSEEALFRRLSLVAAQSTEDATQRLNGVGRHPREGDLAFLATRAAMPGLVETDASGALTAPKQPIARSPESMKALLIDAERKATPADPFNAAPAIEAADELLGLLNSEQGVKAIDDFAAFYKFRLLSRAVTQAIDLAKRPLPEGGLVRTDPTEIAKDDSGAALLKGLSVEAVIAELPNGYSIERSVVAAAVASIRAGKHLLLGGPPGTGKTTLGEALCRAVVGSSYYVTTATADWTTFDTIGGYLPDVNGMRFEPGVVLRALRTKSWLLIDEVNRADIDKAFGPLFTVLSGGEEAACRSSVMPYKTPDGEPVTIAWSSDPATDAVYPISPSWRLIGTLNVSDKASLFQLSFAFLRRFAVIDVPLPVEDAYRNLFERWFVGLDQEDARSLIDVAMAVVTGPVPIGPAIGRDLAKLIVEGLGETASGKPAFTSANQALLIATRLLVVPQYEGQPLTSGTKLLSIIDERISNIGLPERANLEKALHEVALS